MAVYFDFVPKLRALGKDFEWLARESGVSLRQIKRHQARLTKRFRFSTLDKLCAAMRCRPGEILKTEAADD